MTQFITRLSVMVLAISFSSYGMAAQGNCSEESLSKLPPKKRAMIESRCVKSKENNKKIKEASKRKRDWAQAYFADKPAMSKFYREHFRLINGCKDGGQTCAPKDLSTNMFLSQVEEGGLKWLSKSTHNSGATYHCEQWLFSLDGKTLKEHKTYPCN